MSKRKRKLRSGEFTSAAPVLAHREARTERGTIELGAMLDALPNAALLLDSETEQVLHWNQPAKALFGLTAAEALGMPFRCLVPEHLRLALESTDRTVGTLESPTARKKFIEMTVRPLVDRTGHAYTLVHLLDITARHSVATQVRDFTKQQAPAPADVRQAASHTRLMEAMLTHLPVGVFFLDTELAFRFANAHYGALVGIPPPELLGRQFFEVFPNTEAATTQLLAELKRVEPGTPLNGIAIPWELPGAEGDRTTYWDLAVTSVQNDAGGIDGFLVVVNEVSERVRLEQDLNRHIEFLREAQRLANLGSWELELPSRRLIWSAEVFRIFGLEPGSGELSFDDYLHHVHPDDRAAAARVLEEALRTQRPFHSDRRIIRADGAERVLRLWGAPLIDRNGRLRSLYGAIQDITGEHEVQHMKEEFLAIVSHELRTPLSALKGPISMLKSGRFSCEDAIGRDMLALAERNILRMERLVADILDVQRLVTGRLPLRLDRATSRLVVQEVLDMFSEQAREAGVTLESRATPTAVWADPQRAGQVLANLLDNALAFAPRGSAIEVSAEVEDDHVLFRVQDRGPGIPPAHLEDIFTPFRQIESHATRRKRGTGLGLALSRGIVEQHGGRIWAENRPGGGATLSFTLPIAAERH